MMNAKRAFALGRKLGLAKIASVAKTRSPGLVKLAKTLNALERRGKITKKAADAAFGKAAAAWESLPIASMIGHWAGAGGRHGADKPLWQHLPLASSIGNWAGLSPGLTGGGKKPGAVAEAGAAGADGDEGAEGAVGGEVTPQRTAAQMSRYTGMSPQEMSNFNAARLGMLGRSAPYRGMAGDIRGAFGAL